MVESRNALDATDLTDQQALDIAAYVNSHKRPTSIC